MIENNSRIVLLSGGAGYIGSCTAEILRRAGYRPVAMDNFSTSRRPAPRGLTCIEVDLTDLEATRAAVERAGPAHAILHFAAKASVPESCAHPEIYFRNNLLATLNLAQVATETGIRRFVHSSSCAVHGVPEKLPLNELSSLHPLSPYGETKLMAERMLSQFARFRRLQVLNLRYFNPAGALVDAGLGEDHIPEAHLVPNVTRALLAGQEISLFGDDYPTPDGTCVRDFVHIEDLARAHLLGLQYLESHPEASDTTLSLGAGRGISVREVIQAAERVLARQARIAIKPRRPGDPPELWADIQQAKRLLGWTPRKSLDDMLRDHAEWEKIRSSPR